MTRKKLIAIVYNENHYRQQGVNLHILFKHFLNMDSNKELEQPNKDSGTGVEQPSNQWADKLIKLQDWTEVSIDELKSWYLRQSDYTKKSQALAEERKNADNPELDQTKKILKDMWFATVDELTELKKFKDEVLTEKQKLAQETEFNEFTNNFSSLSDNQKTILKDLKKVYTDKSYKDILKETWFVDASLLEKAKTSGGVVWGASLWIPEKKEEISINPKVAQKFWLKSKWEIADLKSKFNL